MQLCMEKSIQDNHISQTPQNIKNWSLFPQSYLLKQMKIVVDGVKSIECGQNSEDFTGLVEAP